MPRPRDPIQGVATDVAAIVGAVPGAAHAEPALVTSLVDFERLAGSAEGETADAVRLFFENGGRSAYVVGLDEAHPRRALDALADVPFGLLVVPATARLREDLATSLAVAASLFARRTRSLYLVDPPAARTAATVARWAGSVGGGPNAAVYFPRLLVRGPSGNRDVAAAGAVAGLLARLDRERGPLAVPGGTAATLRGTVGPAVELADAAVETLGRAAVNPIRGLPGRGTVVWGARTRADAADAEWKYVNVRRYALFLELSIEQGLQWTVFEPNAAPLWSRVRSLARAFLSRLFRQGLFPAAKPEEAFFVRCDRTTMTQDDLDAGRLVLLVGFAPVRPAEFVVLRIRLGARPRGDED